MGPRTPEAAPGLVPARRGASRVARGLSFAGAGGACPGETALGPDRWPGVGAEGPRGREPSDRPDVPGDRVTAQPRRAPSPGRATPVAAGKTRTRARACVPRAPVEQTRPVRFLN